VPSITAVQDVHVAGYIEELTRARSAPTAKQRLSAIRHLFDWLVAELADHPGRESAALLRTMIAYTGTYTIDGDRWITIPDLSHNEIMIPLGFRQFRNRRNIADGSARSAQRHSAAARDHGP
jgi:hypothetical protein